MKQKENIIEEKKSRLCNMSKKNTASVLVA
jgi:hypothetical protein